MPNPRYRPPLTTGVAGTEVAGVSFNDWHTNLKSPSRTPLESPEPSNGGRLLRSEYTLARTTSSVIEAGTNCLGFSGQLTSRRGPCKEVVLAAPPRLGPGGRPVPPLSGGHRHAHPIAELAAGRRACVPDRGHDSADRRALSASAARDDWLSEHRLNVGPQSPTTAIPHEVLHHRRSSRRWSRVASPTPLRSSRPAKPLAWAVSVPHACRVSHRWARRHQKGWRHAPQERTIRRRLASHRSRCRALWGFLAYGPGHTRRCQEWRTHAARVARRRTDGPGPLLRFRPRQAFHEGGAR